MYILQRCLTTSDNNTIDTIYLFLKASISENPHETHSELTLQAPCIFYFFSPIQTLTAIINHASNLIRIIICTFTLPLTYQQYNNQKIFCNMVSHEIIALGVNSSLLGVKL